MFLNTPEKQASYQQTVAEMTIGQQVYAARVKAGLSQAQLAALIQTQPSAISRIEDADYDKHSLSALRKVADALGCRLKVELVPA